MLHAQRAERPDPGLRFPAAGGGGQAAGGIRGGKRAPGEADFSAAEKGGLKAGDVIIEADGKSITKMDELNEIKNTHQIGDEIKLKINRNGNEKEISITLGEQP